MMNSLPKSERLSSKKAIKELFDRGHSGVVFPIRYLSINNNDGINSILVSVSKRHFKRANKRNLIKRRIREAYRINKAPLNGKHLNIAFLYISKELEGFGAIESAVKQIIIKLTES